MTQFIAYAIPNEKIVAENGAVKTTLRFDAANIRQARAIATMSFINNYPEANDEDYEMVVYEDQTGLPAGPLDEWSETILTHYYWNPVTKRPEYCTPGTEGEPDFVKFDKLSSILRAAVLVKFGTTEITADMLTAAMDLTQEEAGTFDGHIVEAISKTPAIAAMYPERQLEAIAHIREKCKPTKKWPEIKAALELWLKAHVNERKDALSDGQRDQVVAEATTTAYSGRSYEHTYRTLNKEIAYALWAGDIDAAKTDPSISRWADGIIADDREDWKRWSAAITTRENILAYDRPTIFGLVRSASDPEIYKTPAKLNLFIDDYLQTQGVIEGGSDDNSQPDAENETGALEDDTAGTDAKDPQQEDAAERQGPFYYRTDSADKIGRANKLAGLTKALAEGCVEISQEEYQARKNGTFTSSETAHLNQGESSQEPTVKKDDLGRFSIEGLTAGQQPVNEHHHSNGDDKPADPPAAASPSAPQNSFQEIAASLEQELSAQTDNLKIWRTVMRTDPRFTKDMEGAGFNGTSVNAEYMIMRATELFGPLGSGWGYEIQEEKFIPGAPLSEAVTVDGKTAYRMLRDADGTLISELHHSVRIRLWYGLDDVEGSVIAYGATPYLYKTNTKGIKTDGEAQKKSLTDAIKKGLSLLGFSADVWLGMYDRPEYVADMQTEFDIKRASDKAEDVTRLRKELDDKLTTNAATLEKSATPNEAKKIYDVIAREAEAHRKAAEAKGDKEHADYLASRLRRLAAIKDQRIKELTEGQSA